MKETVNMSRPSNNFDTLLDKATSHLLTEPDWPSILQICDLISKKEVSYKYALNAVERKLFSQHRITAKLAFLVLESVVKNFVFSILDEIMTKPLGDKLYQLAKRTQDEHASGKVLQMIEAWKIAHSRSPKREPLKDTMQFDTIRMQSEGSKFPSSQESDAMLGVASSSKKQNGDVCYGCRTAFESSQSRCLCGRCEQAFCARCIQKKAILLESRTEKEVHVCDACYSDGIELNEFTAENQSAKGKSKKINEQKETAQERDIDQCLLEYIKQNNLHGVDDCLEKGANINKILSDGHTPLAHAAITRNTQLVEHLLNKSADVCKKGKGGRTPLSIAAEDGNFEMVKILLDRGADATIQIAFLDAIQSKNLDIVKYMKEKGALINWSYKNRLTPLMKALEVGDRTVIEYLIANGATINEEQQTLLLVKNVAEKNLEFIKGYVDSGVDLNKIAPCGCTPLTKATTLEDFEMVKYIVGLGADVNCCGGDGKTALAIAASKNCLQIVKFLMESGADASLAKTEVDDYAEWNEDFDIFLKLYENKVSLKDLASGHEEVEADMN